MISAKYIRLALLSTCALVQVVAQANAQETADQRAAVEEAAVEEVVVTGSRVISNGMEAPTPVTILSADKLLETTPTSVVDALKNLPQFLTEPAVRNTAAQATSNPIGNYLNLRYFGANRSLVLLDGQRLPPTSANGAVDTNIIPQGLVSRVDIVTGGASAVYGSDAITGVVNFILDHEFTGLKYNAQSGISTYGDDNHWKTGATYGTPLLDGRAHFLLSLEHYDSEGVKELRDRPEACCAWVQAGAGTAANPYRLIPDGRTTFNGWGGVIVGSPQFKDVIFKTNGVPSLLVHGLPTGVSVLEQGGDYGTNYGITAVAPLQTNQVFSRFEIDVTDTVKSHLQFSYNDASSKINYIPIASFSGYFIHSGNPFIPSSIQQTMTQDNLPGIRLLRTNKYGDGYPQTHSLTSTTNIHWNAGLEGEVFDNFQWKANYSYSRSTERVTNPVNVDNEKLAASLDAVIDPATGNVVCAVSLTASASRFPGCEPVNMFGPTAPTVSSFHYFTDPTRYTLSHVFHDVNLSVAGSPFSLWAGSVNVAVAGEYRHLALRNTVLRGDATKLADCSGLRPSPNCTPSTLQFGGATAPAQASENVKELSGELLIPLVRDVPMVSALDLNLAGRVTDYSASGTVETWKIGSTWLLNDDLRFRGAVSRDIRAPTLINLFGPSAQSAGQVTDIHTGVTIQSPNINQANPNLVPEVARTYTAGFVYQPSFIPRFSLAVDYYNININNAIESVSGADPVLQQQCELSNGTSPFCSLLVRPLPFSDRSPANAPTQILRQPLNVARAWTHGIDVEANYNFNAASVISSVPGEFVVRALVSYQPLARSQTVPTLPYVETAGIAVAGLASGNASGTSGYGFSKVRANLNLAYTNDGFSATLVERIQSGMHVTDPRLFVDTRPDISTHAYTDVSISNRFESSGGEFTPFLTVQNLFDKRPPIVGSSSLQPDGTFPTATGYDVIGRYFTIGLRGAF